MRIPTNPPCYLSNGPVQSRLADGGVMQQQQVEAWLTQLGCKPAAVTSIEGNVWQLQFVFPPGSQQTLACFAPRTPEGSTVISVNYPLMQAEAVYDSLSETERALFQQELRGVLS